MKNEDILEWLCNVQHNMWQRFVSNLVKNIKQDGSVVINPTVMSRWQKMASIEYNDLPDNVKSNIKSSVCNYVNDLKNMNIIVDDQIQLEHVNQPETETQDELVEVDISDNDNITKDANIVENG